jgi:hypothetical protein
VITLASNITEAIRNARKRDGIKFSWRTFTDLAAHGDVEGGKSLPQRIETAQWYARSHLKKLGQGGARAAYLLTSRSVLKIALDIPGIDQNIEEWTISDNTERNAPIARCLQRSTPPMIWIVSELVRPVHSDIEFVELCGYDLQDVMSELRDAQRALQLGKHPTERSIGDAFIWSVWKLVSKNSIALLDVDKLAHWGVTADRRLVLLDYGYTVDMLRDIRSGFMGHLFDDE